MLQFNVGPAAASDEAPSEISERVIPVNSPPAHLAEDTPAKAGNVGALRVGQLVNPRDACLTKEEKARIYAIISASTAITSHAEFFWWLHGELQTFLPHQVMIAAWGNFQTWHLKFDVVSNIPGARTESIARCESFSTCKINTAFADLSSRWFSEGRRPFLVRDTRKLLSCAQSPCCLIKAMQPMRSILVHGVHDERGGYDSLYLLFSSGSITSGRSEATVADIAGLLVPQIDIALRKVTPLPNAETTSSVKRNGEAVGLTMREREIVDWIARGKMNAEIGAKLRISTWTVKNHLRRIFKKLNATNRADAVTKYQRTRYENTL